MFLVFTLLYIAYDYLLATNSIVSRAITISSSVGTTTTFTLLSSVEMIASSPRTLSFTSFIDLDAKILQVLARILAEVGLVLTYTSCEYDSVNATHSCCVSTNILLDAILVHAESQLSLLVTLVGSVLDVAHIRRNTCNTEHTTLPIK